LGAAAVEGSAVVRERVWRAEIQIDRQGCNAHLSRRRRSLWHAGYARVELLKEVHRLIFGAGL
jgi:hypothetical protein